MDETNQQPQASMPQGAPMPTATGDDVSKHKAFAVIGYIIPILFFIPMLSEEGKKSQYAMFHANQQLIQLIGWVISGFLTFILIGFILYIFMFIIMIMGIVSAAKGTMKPAPLVGSIKILS